MVLVVKILPVKEGDIRDGGSIPGSGRSPGGGHGNPLWYSCLENSMDRGTWWTTVGSQRVRHDRSDLARTQAFQYLSHVYQALFVLDAEDTSDKTV